MFWLNRIHEKSINIYFVNVLNNLCKPMTIIMRDKKLMSRMVVNTLLTSISVRAKPSIGLLISL